MPASTPPRARSAMTKSRPHAARAATATGSQRAVHEASAAAARSPPGAEIAAHPGDPNYMASLARGLSVIRAFAQQRARVSIAQLSARTGIPRAAVRRVLYTLRTLG